MNRRHFLKALAATGVASGMPFGAMNSHAASNGGPKYFVSCAAIGGWDQTMWCDPKGKELSVNGITPINRFSSNNIRGAKGKPGIGYKAGTPFSWAPPVHGLPGLSAAEDTDALFEHFFINLAEEHGMIMLNGVDAQTNSHAAGTRATFSGTLQAAFPNIGALHAAINNPDLQMPFITFGGYDGTGSLIPLSRIGDPKMFETIINHDVAMLGDNTNALIKSLSLQQAERYKNQAVNAQHQRTLSKYLTSKGGEFSVKYILDRVPRYASSDPATHTLENALPPGSDGLLNANGNLLQVELITAAFSAGLTVSGNLFLTGIDSHADNDIKQVGGHINNVKVVDHFWKMAAYMDENYGSDITENTTMLIGSEFGRTPWYNNGDPIQGGGKDHWTTTSVIAMGYGIRGKIRLFGASSDDKFTPMKMNEQAQLDENGFRIRSEIIHTALRDQVLKISDHSFSRKYTLGANLPQLPFFV